MGNPQSCKLSFFAMFIAFTKFSIVLAQTCYFPDQQTIAENYTPCNSSAIEHAGGSACCAGGATCLSDGLCYLIYDMSINMGACTDQSWESSACFHGCPSEYTTDNTNTLYRCDDNQWCCSEGGNTTSCCNDPHVNLFSPIPDNSVAAIYNGSGIAAGYVLTSTTSSTSSGTASPTNPNGGKATATKEVCPTAGSARDSTACPSPNASSSSSDTAKVGVGVGVRVGVPLLAALAAVLFLWSREKKRNREYQRQAVTPGQPSYGKLPMGYGPSNGMQGGNQVYHEVPGQMGDYGAAEVPGSDSRREMSTSPTAK